MEKKQSSIEWLENEIDFILLTYSYNSQDFHLNKAFEQAKAMHKEEIKDAISVGYNMATPSEPYENLHKGDKYYNQKFGWEQ